MDYEQLSTRELQDECRRRGLPSGRVKAELIARLTEADTADAGSAGDDFDDTPVEGASSEPVVEVTAQPDLLPPEPAPFKTTDPEPATPFVFRQTFKVGPGGLDDGTHAEFRQKTIDAAVEAGHKPRGGAYRVGTTTNGDVYEVIVRRRS